MRNLYQCRRGSVAFATVVALIPLIGFLALGAEAGSWFVTRNQAQNTADSAALAGALAVANTNVQPDFGTLNGFASGVVVTSGIYTAGTGFAAGAVPANAVRAVVTECRPQSLSLVVYTGSCNGTDSNIKIEATAIASVQTPAKLPCAMSLTGPITFKDAAVEINAPNCSLASNGTPLGIEFQVAPKTYNVGSVTTAGGCSGSLCGSVSTYAPPTINPYELLTNSINGLTLSPCSGSTLRPYEGFNCANNNVTINSATTLDTSGVYFFSGGLTLGGNGALSTGVGVTATIIIIPDGTKTSLKMAGGSTFKISSPATAPSASAVPGALSSVRYLLANMAIFDPELSPQIVGGATMTGSGVFYLPNAALNFKGDSTSTSTPSTCTQVIAASIQFTGTPTLDNTGCPESIKIKSQVVALVQ
ncbi:MAG: pilus assembly protein TadG-related protein [Beijerinckiaceae bacterium]|nr:pilus assembly protein TadG-related protein [Beijerinckiaceae bacterium]